MTRPGFDKSLTGAAARRSGRGAEWLALLILSLKGYRILGFRLKTRAGEIDILARRGGVLVVVEVKQRARLDDALLALSARQRRRLRAAGAMIAASRPEYAGLDLRHDLFATAPGRWPKHIKNIDL